jgi:hypothetical protein
LETSEDLPPISHHRATLAPTLSFLFPSLHNLCDLSRVDTENGHATPAAWIPEEHSADEYPSYSGPTVRLTRPAGVKMKSNRIEKNEQKVQVTLATLSTSYCSSRANLTKSFQISPRNQSYRLVLMSLSRVFRSEARQTRLLFPHMGLMVFLVVGMNSNEAFF